MLQRLVCKIYDYMINDSYFYSPKIYNCFMCMSPSFFLYVRAHVYLGAQKGHPILEMNYKLL